jgi:hypothetical protein
MDTLTGSLPATQPSDTVADAAEKDAGLAKVLDLPRREASDPANPSARRSQDR